MCCKAHIVSALIARAVVLYSKAVLRGTCPRPPWATCVAASMAVVYESLASIQCRARHIKRPETWAVCCGLACMLLEYARLTCDVQPLRRLTCVLAAVVAATAFMGYLCAHVCIRLAWLASIHTRASSTCCVVVQHACCGRYNVLYG